MSKFNLKSIKEEFKAKGIFYTTNELALLIKSFVDIEIEEVWEIKRIKRIAEILRGASPRPIDDEKYFDDNSEFSWVRISDVTASETYLMRLMKNYPNWEAL